MYHKENVNLCPIKEYNDLSSEMENDINSRSVRLKSSESNAHVHICVNPPTTINYNNTRIEDNSSVFRSGNTEYATCSLLGEMKTFCRHFRISTLVIVWALCSGLLMINKEKVLDKHQISIQKYLTNNYMILEKPKLNKLKVILEGALLPKYYGNLSTEWLDVWIQLISLKQKPVPTNDIKQTDIMLVQNISNVWRIPLVTENLIGVVPEVTYSKIFELSSFVVDNSSFDFFRIQFRTNLHANLPLLMDYNLEPINPRDGIVYAALVLCGLYVLIIFEIIHRTLAAILASTLSVAILAVLNSRPTMSEIISWIDTDTLLLLFSMMTLVTVFSETGIFDYLSVVAYKHTKGKLWPLINMLCLIVILLSCFLDNVTTALLTTPITIKLCEVMKINPVPVLTITLIFSNIGGAITPIGDPPNVIIASNSDVIKSGINFGIFTLHMGIGTILAVIVTYIQFRIVYRDQSSFKLPESDEIQDLKREIAVWQRTAASVSSYSKDEEAVKESLKKKTEKLQTVLRATLSNSSPEKDKKENEKYIKNLVHLEKQHPIRNKVLLVKSGITLLLVVAALFLHSVPVLSRLGLGWTALLGAILLLILYDNEIEGIFARVEWSTLMFFASLFILMEALSKLGLIEYVGKITQTIIMSVDPKARLTVSIILILWVSAIVSAFVDNVPLTTMMIKVTTDLAKQNEVDLPLQPLIWALSFGACMGGNASLFGSSANIICAGVAEQHGYKFSFIDFMRVGIPVSLLTLSITTGYLIVCHVVLEWH